MMIGDVHSVPIPCVLSHVVDTVGTQPVVNREQQAKSSQGYTGLRSKVYSNSHVIRMLAQQELQELGDVEMPTCLPIRLTAQSLN